MKRRDFLKGVGLGAGILATSKIALAIPNNESLEDFSNEDSLNKADESLIGLSKIRESHQELYQHDINSMMTIYRFDAMFMENSKRSQYLVDFMTNGEPPTEQETIRTLSNLLNALNHKGVSISDLLDLPLGENQRYLPMDFVKHCIMQSNI